MQWRSKSSLRMAEGAKVENCYAVLSRATLMSVGQVKDRSRASIFESELREVYM